MLGNDPERKKNQISKDMKSVKESLLERRSIRRYERQPIEPEKLDFIYEAIRNAPTSYNGQQFSVIAVTDQALKEQLYEITGQKQINGAHKIIVEADRLFEETDFSDGDMLVLPGGMPGTLNLAGNETLAALIRSYDDQGKKLAAICAAPSILGVMGILKDKNAVCFPGFEEKLAGANVLDVPAVTDKNVTTGRGMGAATDFALELIRVLQGEDKAKEMAEKIVFHC